MSLSLSSVTHTHTLDVLVSNSQSESLDFFSHTQGKTRTLPSYLNSHASFPRFDAWEMVGEIKDLSLRIDWWWWDGLEVFLVGSLRDGWFSVKQRVMMTGWWTMNLTITLHIFFMAFCCWYLGMRMTISVICGSWWWHERGGILGLVCDLRMLHMSLCEKNWTHEWSFSITNKSFQKCRVSFKCFFESFSLRKNGQHKIWKIIFSGVCLERTRKKRKRDRCIEINYINYDIEKEHHQSSLSIEEKKRSRVILSLSPYCLVKAP